MKFDFSTKFYPAQAFRVGDVLELSIRGVTVAFRYSPPGRFLMGQSDGERSDYVCVPQREVRLTCGIWLLETPVTQGLWKAVTGSNPSYFQGADARPAENVSWNACRKFIRELNKIGIAPRGLTFDFPTEAEWERACRAGTTTAYNFGDVITENDANYARHIEETTPVKSYEPNAWGFYDMHGNVSEWVFDASISFQPLPELDPAAKRGDHRVVRGGDWTQDERRCESSFRSNFNVCYSDSNIGFRLALRNSRPNASR